MEIENKLYVINVKIVADEVKNRNWQYLKSVKPDDYKNALLDLKRKFRKLRAVDDMDEIRLVSKQPVTEEVSQIAQEYNVLVVVGGVE